MSTKTEFASKIGLIAATVGSAVGLGNIWRFPAEAQAGGGSAFLLLYVLCVLLLGVPVMLAECSPTATLSVLSASSHPARSGGQ